MLVPTKIDLFLRLGHVLKDKKLLGVGMTPASFAALRFQAEQEANRENRSSLKEIYAHLPAQACSLPPDQLESLEKNIAHEVAFLPSPTFRSRKALAEKDILFLNEHPVNWDERTAWFATPLGDAGLSSLRRAMLSQTPPHITSNEAFFYTYGATHMGPLLAGFVAWATKRAWQEGAGSFLCREEESLLCALGKTLAPSLTWISGYTSPIPTGTFGLELGLIKGSTKLPHTLTLLSERTDRERQTKGLIVEGFLSQNGNPVGFMNAVMRAPDILRLCCAPAKEGSEVSIIQQGALAFTRQWHDLLTARPEPPDFTDPAWVLQMRGLAQRLIVFPTRDEATHLGRWTNDQGVCLTSAGPRQRALPWMNGAQMASLPPHESPWLYAAATLSDEILAQQVADIMLRRVAPDHLPPRRPPLPVPFPDEPPPPTSVVKELISEADAFFEKLRSGTLTRETVFALMQRPSPTHRRLLTARLAENFDSIKAFEDSALLWHKTWIIGARDYTTFQKLVTAHEKAGTYAQGVEDISSPILREACLAAHNRHHPDYIWDVIHRWHGAAYRAYAAQKPHAPFQDDALVTAARDVFGPFRPPLNERKAPSSRCLSLGFVLSGEMETAYSPLPDISLALAEDHIEKGGTVTIVSTHAQKDVALRSPVYPRLESLQKKGCTLLFRSEHLVTSQTEALFDLAGRMAAETCDAFLFSTLTGDAFCLAALRPAPLMADIGLGNNHFYTSPLLDLTAHIVDFPAMDAPNASVRLPDFMPSGRFQPPEKPVGKTALGLAEKDILILSSGRVLKFFSDSYWRIISHILHEKPEAALCVIGPTEQDISPWMTKYIPDALKSRIKALGWRADHGALVATADIVLDTFPMGGGYNLTEAMNLGVPTILCRNRLKDFLMPYREQCWMPIGEILSHPNLAFDWDDEAGITRTILRLVGDPSLRRKLGTELTIIARQRADIKPTAQALDQALRKALEQAD